MLKKIAAWESPASQWTHPLAGGVERPKPLLFEKFVAALEGVGGREKMKFSLPPHFGVFL
ncbi:MAG: hypothetical protein IPN76_18215 [Saprospiraceae bacterium]|nr:hypothetical protein [Saprospiraceae bacterium]